MKFAGMFRYIVVGGGSAGCLLARSLAEGQTGMVALIEAGPVSNDVRSSVPNYYPRAFRSSLDWNYSTEPQPGLGGRRLAWPRGKLLGGSGAINALIFLQAARADFIRWGWDWAMEQWQCDSKQPLISRERLAEPHAWTLAFVRAAVQYGCVEVHDFDQSQAGCCGVLQLTQVAGRRAHTGFDPKRLELQKLSNLRILSGYQAERIVLDNAIARGVELRDSQNQPVFIEADAEVVVCCGTIGSPLLMLQSGIGAPDELQKIQINCVHPLTAVGHNLQDHLVYPLIFEARDGHGLPRRHSIAARQQYRRSGTGGLASNIAEAAALCGLNADVFSSTELRSAAQLSPALPQQSEPSEFQVHFTPTHYLKYPQTPTENNHLSLAVTDLHPRSRGVVRATRGAAGKLLPLIDPRYLSQTEDIQRMLAAIRWTREIADQPALRELTQREIMPGAKRQSEASLAKALSTFSQSIYHPVGTCRMSTGFESGDDCTVVDREFRVHGIAGLRIADASVLPDLPSGNTNAVTLLLAAQAAKVLLES